METLPVSLVPGGEILGVQARNRPVAGTQLSRQLCIQHTFNSTAVTMCWNCDDIIIADIRNVVVESTEYVDYTSR